MRTNEKALNDLKMELKKSYDIMSHLKKKINNNSDSTNFNTIMNEISTVLQIPKPSDTRPVVKSKNEIAKSPI